MNSTVREQASEAAARFAGPYRIGVGCMAITGLYGHVPNDQARSVIRRAADLGFRLFDTAPLYANGANEELLGDALGRDPDTFISTKFGLYEKKDGSLLRDSRPAVIRASVEESLRRLKRDRIDLLLQHRPDPNVDDNEVADAVNELVSEGKVAAFGLSGTGIDRSHSINARCRVAAIQNELSPLSGLNSLRSPRDVAELGAVFMSYAPLARGLLTKTSSAEVGSGDYRSKLPSFSDPESSVPVALSKAISRLASKHEVTPAAVVLHWVRSIAPNVIPLPGPRRLEHLSDLLLAKEAKLSLDDLFDLEEAL